MDSETIIQLSSVNVNHENLSQSYLNWECIEQCLNENGNACS